MGCSWSLVSTQKIARDFWRIGRLVLKNGVKIEVYVQNQYVKWLSSSDCPLLPRGRSARTTCVRVVFAEKLSHVYPHVSMPHPTPTSTSALSPSCSLSFHTEAPPSHLPSLPLSYGGRTHLSSLNPPYSRRSSMEDQRRTTPTSFSTTSTIFSSPET